MQSHEVDPQLEALWRDVLLHGHAGRWAFLPAEPRCIVCQQPFKGVGGTILRMFTGYKPSRMSPNMCNVCEDSMPRGGAEVDTAVLFADIRGSTKLGEQLPPSEFAALINRFYQETSNVLIAAQGWIDKFVGDEIMALYVPSMGPDYRKRAVLTGLEMLKVVGYAPGKTPWVEVGVGIHAGPAYVGKVGTDGSNAVTALGDTVNIAARIQEEAKGGELVLSEDLYPATADRYPNAERRVLTVKGKDEPLMVRVIRPGEG